MSALTRRQALSLLPAASAAVAAPALATAAVSVADSAGGDEGLLSLGSAFAATLVAYEEACRRAYPLHDIYERELSARGLSWFENDRAAERAAVERETGFWAASKRMNSLCGQAVRLSRKIRRTTPKTLPGLAVWARAALFEATDYMPRSNALHDATAGNAEIHALIAHVERMAGRA